jgi:pimeloyl-ACP methyl ester carboxylesterase
VSDFVLIHSTGQSAAGWQRVVSALEARGHSAHAVDLPDDRPELEADDYAELMRNQIGGAEGSIVVAHSGSGVLLPAAARVFGGQRQVWLAAWVPHPRASFNDEVDDHVDEAFNPAWIGKDPTADAAVAAHFLYHDCDWASLEWALTTRRRFLPLAVFDACVSLADEIPSTYVVAAYDRTIRPEWQRRMARERLRVEPVEIPTGHCPNVARPDLLADLLADVN